MKLRYLLLCCLPLLMACPSAASYQQHTKLRFTVKNTLDSSREDALISIAADDLRAKLPELNVHQLTFTQDGRTLPYQLLSEAQNEERLLLLLDLEANEELTIQVENGTIAAGPPTLKRTQAEISHKVGGVWEGRTYKGGDFKNTDDLRVPEAHTDHSWYIRYEGPGWESDLIGYRFYLDWRNAIDIFGKRKPQMVLQDVGLDGFDTYHQPADWGMDILKVGSSLGIGSAGYWQDGKAVHIASTDSVRCRITQNGIYQSSITTNYYNWNVGALSGDLESRLSIQAGSRLTLHELKLSRAFPNLCTGIVKHEKAERFSYDNGTWGYIATWGTQSLADDHLGMAILYKSEALQQITEDEHNHVVILTPQDNELSYYFLAAWEQEPNGIQTLGAFQMYLNDLLNQLSTPLVVRL